MRIISCVLEGRASIPWTIVDKSEVPLTRMCGMARQLFKTWRDRMFVLYKLLLCWHPIYAAMSYLADQHERISFSCVGWSAGLQRHGGIQYFIVCFAGPSSHPTRRYSCPTQLTHRWQFSATNLLYGMVALPSKTWRDTVFELYSLVLMRAVYPS